MDKNEIDVYTNEVTGDVAEFRYCRDLTVSTQIRFVSSVVSNIADQFYYPMLRDMMFDYAIVRFFTDIDLENDMSVDDIETLIRTTNIADIVKVNMRDGLLDELNRAVDINIEAKTGVRPNKLEDALLRILKMVENKLGDMDFSKMSAKIDDALKQLTPEEFMRAYGQSEVFAKRFNAAQAEKPHKHTMTGGLRVIE